MNHPSFEIKKFSIMIIKNYIEKFGKHMDIERLNYICNNLENIVEISDNISFMGTCYSDENAMAKVKLNSNPQKVLSVVAENPTFDGTELKTMAINREKYTDEEIYEMVLPHEILHLMGIGGGDYLGEGITEYYSQKESQNAGIKVCVGSYSGEVEIIKKT